MSMSRKSGGSTRADSCFRCLSFPRTEGRPSEFLGADAPLANPAHARADRAPAGWRAPAVRRFADSVESASAVEPAPELGWLLVRSHREADAAVSPHDFGPRRFNAPARIPESWPILGLVIQIMISKSDSVEVYQDKLGDSS